jgi:C4-dicarboxylate-specific signal transduction histidine kinase
MANESLTILFVEDDPSMQVLFSYLVKGRVDNVISAQDGISGLEAFRKHRPDLVITDIQMPGISGMEMIRTIRTIDPAAPCVILSAYSIPEYFIEAIEIGVQGFLLKPLKKDQLIRLLDQQKSAILAERRLLEQEQRRLLAEEELRKLNEELEDRVSRRTEELARENLERSKVEQELLSLNRSLEKRVVEELRKREKQQNLLIQKSKLESMGELAAGLAHELNQPLAGISMTLENVGYHLKKDNIEKVYIQRKIDNCFEDLDRIRHLIEHVRTFSRDQHDQNKTRVDVKTVIGNALSMVMTQYRNHQINLIVRLPDEPLLCQGNAYRLEQVLLNLLSNAKHAVDAKLTSLGGSVFHKEIMIGASRVGNEVIVEVTDNGTGIQHQHINRIFDPFFTTKEQELGTGLGLSIAYGIIKDMEGEIEVQSKPGVFTCMRFRLPYHTDPDSNERSA